MFLKARLLEFEADKPIALLNREDAEELDVKPLERIEISIGRKNLIAIVNIAEKVINQGEIGLYQEIQEELRIKPDERVDVEPANPPESLAYIKKKLSGGSLSPREMETIVRDTVHRNLSEIELTAFVTSLHNYGMNMGEIASLSRAMAKTGETLKLKTKEIYDKHSVGGCPGDKTSILVVPITAVAGLTIPKTSSRAITSPAGTADRFECLAPVELNLEEVKRVVNKTNGCLVWGGSVDLAPADDMFIRIEYPLSIDPFLLPSVMSKKKAVNTKYLVIDIPTGRETKITSMEEFEKLANRFISLGNRLGIKVNAVSTFAEQPIGYAVGPLLEAREALETIKTGAGPKDLIDKAATLAGVLLDFSGQRNGKRKALGILRSGKAYKKLMEIIEAQGGDPNKKPEDLTPGPRKAEIKSNRSGKILWISTNAVDRIAREAGAPKNKGSGILLHKKLGDSVKKGETLFEVFAKKQGKFNRALKLARDMDIVRVGKETEIKLEKIPSKEEEERYFILER